MSPDEESLTISRRRLLAASSAGALAATSGCVQRVRSILNRDSPSTASVSILTPPTDVDEIATQIANEFAENLDAVGIDTDVEFLPYVELYREVLLNRDYQVFVGRMPGVFDPDDLRRMLHSRFGEEPGWQNPYGFANLVIDDDLIDQKTIEPPDRSQFAHDLLSKITREQPFIPIGELYGIRAVGETSLTGWDRFDSFTPLNYLGLVREERVRGNEPITLRVGIVDARITRNLNPLSVEYREEEPYLGLIYDPLAYRIGDHFVPWLASEITWDDEAEDTTAILTLREDLTWHDESRITADDIAFTYEFLEDTTMGEQEVSAPTPRYRGRSSVVEDVDVLDERTARVRFGGVTTQVARRAFTVPLLPRHIWEHRTDPADISGVDSGEGVTAALVNENDDPVGSGPMVVEDVSAGESVDLVRNEDHFLHTGPVDLDLPEPEHRWFEDGLAFDRLELRTSPSDETAVEAVSAGNVNATSATLSPAIVPRIGEASNVTLFVDSDTTRRTYHIGLNTSSAPFSNPYFRRLIARLIDKSAIVDDIFENYGRPVATPLAGTEWSPESLAFEDEDPEVPFLGSDGEVDVGSARDAFREHGFEFNEDGDLIIR